MNYKALSLTFAAFLGASSIFAQAKQSASQVAQAIGDRIISETPYLFVNKATGQT